MTRVAMGDDVDPEMLLALWERGVGQPESAPGDALLEGAPGATRTRTLGERNVRLIELHAWLFGPTMDLLSHCPSCRTVAQFTSDCEALAAQMRVVDETSSHCLEVQGHVIEFRLPDAADVAAASREEALEGFAQNLLDRCVLACAHDGASVPVRALPAPVLDALSQRMETLDPGANVSFALECPQCATRWDAPLDVGQMVWQKVQAAAERLLLDVDALARAYGWTEREVLRLSPLRRAAYLQLVAA
jgi:hypothetical protein